jgi:hypothetical protein
MRLTCHLDYASDRFGQFGFVDPNASDVWGNRRVKRPSAFDGGHVTVVDIIDNVRGKCDDDILGDFIGRRDEVTNQWCVC